MEGVIISAYQNGSALQIDMIMFDQLIVSSVKFGKYLAEFFFIPIALLSYLSFTSSGLVIVSALALVACLLSDKGSLDDIRRSFDAFWQIRSDFMENPTPASRLSFYFASTPEECVASTNFFDLHVPYLCIASLTQGQQSLYPISAKFSSNGSRPTLWSI